MGIRRFLVHRVLLDFVDTTAGFRAGRRLKAIDDGIFERVKGARVSFNVGCIGLDFGICLKRWREAFCTGSVKNESFFGSGGFL
ncbi:hypothetical protein BOA8489_03348 [Boseongicola aestuarii]|uniref:Uncharacterized protein n=1 Tax=Boseongicola aestuarii TaxID=1470561 RepID=A0A238J4E4_9RHOB|nr:hypothetical protein BOA8489_03348 [Boseongicola aestuarii]